MKMDSEEQRTNLLALISKVPIQTDMGKLFEGPPQEMRDLVDAIKGAELEEPEEE